MIFQFIELHLYKRQNGTSLHKGHFKIFIKSKYKYEQNFLCTKSY